MVTKIKINGDKVIRHERIKAKLGLTDKKNHSVFYLEGGTFVKPECDFENFENIMDVVKTSCKKTIKRKLFKNPFLDSVFLMNFEVCSERMKKGKSSYLSFQYHFRQKNSENKSILTVKNENEHFFLDLLDDLEYNLNQFNIDLNQKRNW